MEDNASLILHMLYVRLTQTEAMLDWLSQRQPDDQVRIARHAVTTATAAVKTMKETAAVGDRAAS